MTHPKCLFRSLDTWLTLKILCLSCDSRITCTFIWVWLFLILDSLLWCTCLLSCNYPNLKSMSHLGILLFLKSMAKDQVFMFSVTLPNMEIQHSFTCWSELFPLIFPIFCTICSIKKVLLYRLMFFPWQRWKYVFQSS